LLEKNDWSKEACPPKGANQVCPKCGAKKLFHERLPDGRVETICLDLECDFSEVIAGVGSGENPDSDFFTGRVGQMTESQLRQCEEKLLCSAESLNGRAKRLAQRQLALVQAELEHRVEASSRERTVTSGKTRSADRKVPPQFNTPEAVAKRIAGIRNYHRRRKGERTQTEFPIGLFNPARWLDRLLKNLRDEAGRHEQAAKNYARVPELFPLHIEHSARAFELNRVLDLLDNYVDIICSEEEFNDGIR
jgi:hypothetical protein